MARASWYTCIILSTSLLACAPRVTSADGDGEHGDASDGSVTDGESGSDGDHETESDTETGSESGTASDTETDSGSETDTGSGIDEGPPALACSSWSALRLSAKELRMVSSNGAELVTLADDELIAHEAGSWIRHDLSYFVEQEKAVWAASATDVWMVGESSATAYLLHWDGSEVTTVLDLPKSMTTNHRLDWVLSGTVSDDVYAVGLCTYCDDDECPCLEEPSSVLHFDGQVWTELPTPGARVRRVWAHGGSAYVIGEAMLRWDGVSWQPVPGYPDALVSGPSDIWGTSDTDIWIGGQEGALWHFDGITWTDMSLPEGGPVITIDGTSATRVWALVSPHFLQIDEEPSRIYAFDGSTWTLALSLHEINDIAVLDGGLIGVGSTDEYLGQRVEAIDTEFGVVEELYRREDLGSVNAVHAETISDAVVVIRRVNVLDVELALLRRVDGEWQFESLDGPAPDRVIDLISVPGEAPYALADANEPTILWRFEDPVFVPLEAPAGHFYTVAGARVGDEIWVAGGTAPSPRVVRFDGTQWFDVPFEDPAINGVTGLTAAGGRVFVTVLRSGDLPEQLLRREGDAWVPLTDDDVHNFSFEHRHVHASAAERLWISASTFHDGPDLWDLYTWDGDEIALMSDQWPELAEWEAAVIGGANSANVWLARVTESQPSDIAYWNGDEMNLLEAVPAEFEASDHGSIHPSEDGQGVVVYSSSADMLWHCGP